ncbi:MAG: hypothetical protein JRN22_00305, partial [Nitrososphaerota archaeon]|nr:hypothetical protein [Nitrososphaerota archaeon]
MGTYDNRASDEVVDSPLLLPGDLPPGSAPGTVQPVFDLADRSRPGRGSMTAAVPGRAHVADLAEIRAQFSPAPGIAYLDSATYGLPPGATVEAIQRALAAWSAGTGDWIEDWDRPSDACRGDFASL